jgi:hypothetical protein
MWVGLETEVGARMRERVGEAERRRLLGHAKRGQAGGPRRQGGYRRLREAAGFGLVRTGLWLLDARGAGS